MTGRAMTVVALGSAAAVAAAIALVWRPVPPRPDYRREALLQVKHAEECTPYAALRVTEHGGTRYCRRMTHLLLDQAESGPPSLKSGPPAAGQPKPDRIGWSAVPPSLRCFFPVVDVDLALANYDVTAQPGEVRFVPRVPGRRALVLRYDLATMLPEAFFLYDPVGAHLRADRLEELRALPLQVAEVQAESMSSGAKEWESSICDPTISGGPRGVDAFVPKVLPAGFALCEIRCSAIGERPAARFTYTDGIMLAMVFCCRSVDAEEMLGATGRGTDPDGALVVERRSHSRTRSLLARIGDTTVVVIGAVTERELTDMVASLAPMRAP